MKCPFCMEEIRPDALICKHCKTHLKGPQPGVRRPGPAPAEGALGWLIPVNVSVWAFLAGYTGMFAIALLPAPFALLFGILGVRDIRQHPEKDGYGRAIFGIVTGLLGTLLLFGVVILPLLTGR